MPPDYERREHDRVMSEEIHSIKENLRSLTSTVNSLVHKLANVSVLENQQINDRDTIKTLAQTVSELTKAVNALNTSVATSDGIAKGKRMVLGAIAGLLSILIVSIISTVVIHNSKLGEHEVDLKNIKADIQAIKDRK